MPVEGVPRFNAVTLLEIEAVDFSVADVALVARGAYVDTRTGKTYGETSCRRWSPETIAKLGELRRAMEQDLAALVFETEESTGAAAATGLRMSAPTGIGERLATDAESV